MYYFSSFYGEEHQVHKSQTLWDTVTPCSNAKIKTPIAWLLKWRPLKTVVPAKRMPRAARHCVSLSIYVVASFCCSVLKQMPRRTLAAPRQGCSPSLQHPVQRHCGCYVWNYSGQLKIFLLKVLCSSVSLTSRREACSWSRISGLPLIPAESKGPVVKIPRWCLKVQLWILI